LRGGDWEDCRPAQAKYSLDPTSNNEALTCHPSYSGRQKQEDHKVMLLNPIKNKQQKKAGRVTQVVEHQHSKI
jgi:hypothetical protein